MLFDGLGRVPSPLAVLVVLGEAPQIEIGLDHLGPQDVVLLVGLDGHRFRVAALEVKRLGSQASRRTNIGLVASVGSETIVKIK